MALVSPQAKRSARSSAESGEGFWDADIETAAARLQKIDDIAVIVVDIAFLNSACRSAADAGGGGDGASELGSCARNADADPATVKPMTYVTVEVDSESENDYEMCEANCDL